MDILTTLALSHWQSWLSMIFVVASIITLTYLIKTKKTKLINSTAIIIGVIGFLLFGILTIEPINGTHYIGTNSWEGEATSWFSIVPMMLISLVSSVISLYIFSKIMKSTTNTKEKISSKVGIIRLSISIGTVAISFIIFWLASFLIHPVSQHSFFYRFEVPTSSFEVNTINDVFVSVVPQMLTILASPILIIGTIIFSYIFGLSIRKFANIETSTSFNNFFIVVVDIFENFIKFVLRLFPFAITTALPAIMLRIPSSILFFNYGLVVSIELSFVYFITIFILCLIPMFITLFKFKEIYEKEKNEKWMNEYGGMFTSIILASSISLMSFYLTYGYQLGNLLFIASILIITSLFVREFENYWLIISVVAFVGTSIPFTFLIFVIGFSPLLKVFSNIWEETLEQISRLYISKKV